MKRLSKTIILVIFAVILTSQVASAKTVNVTAKYKKKFTKTLRCFDSTLGYSCYVRTKFKFNDYTRTVMLFNSGLMEYTENTAKAKRNIKPLMKKIFGRKTVKLHKYKGSYCPDISWIYTDKNGHLQIQKGDWGMEYPVGRVLSVIQKGGKTFIAKYHVRLYYPDANMYLSKLGDFSVTFKKKSGKYIISDIKRTRIW